MKRNQATPRTPRTLPFASLMNGRTHYDTLGLEPAATTEEIRHAWKTLIQVWHPDRFSGHLRAEAEEMTKAINEAYEELRHPARRNAYDSASWPPPPSEQSYPGPSSTPPSSTPTCRTKCAWP